MIFSGLKNSLFYFKLLIFSISIFLLACSKKSIDLPFSEIQTPISTRINKTFWQNALTGFICGGEKGNSGYIYKTNDGGISWQIAHQTTNQSLYDIYFVDSLTGYCCGESLLLLTTNDGGLTWNKFNYPIEAPSYEILTLRAITGNKNFVLIVGGDNFNLGVSLKFINGGFPWQFYRYDAEMRTAVAFNIHNYISCGYGLTYQTKDTGFNFTPLPATNDFFTGSSVTNNTAFACGYNGGIYTIGHTENSWTQILDANKAFKRSHIHLNGICMINETYGYAVGNDGLVLKTTNGKDWKKCNPLGNSNLLSISKNNNGQLVISSQTGKLYVIEI